MSISTSKHGVAALAVGVLLLAGCGGDDDGEAVTETTEPEAPPVEFPVAVETTTDVPYTSERSLDIYEPTEGSDWPVVVYFHGGPPAPGARTSPETLSAIAEQGIVVYAPDWRSNGPAGGSEDSVCAVAFAEATAADHGGDADAVTLAGYSTGGYTALIHGYMADDPPLPVTDCARRSGGEPARGGCGGRHPTVRRRVGTGRQAPPSRMDRADAGTARPVRPRAPGGREPDDGHQPLRR